MNKQAMKWKRVRPGLYRLNDDEGEVAFIERGAETGLWWWSVDLVGAWPETGNADALRDAKQTVEEYLR